VVVAFHNCGHKSYLEKYSCGDAHFNFIASRSSIEKYEIMSFTNKDDGPNIIEEFIESQQSLWKEN